MIDTTALLIAIFGMGALVFPSSNIPFQKEKAKMQQTSPKNPLPNEASAFPSLSFLN
jgi:hypothetical protein